MSWQIVGLSPDEVIEFFQLTKQTYRTGITTKNKKNNVSGE
jgi:hypothetical protein